MIRIHTFTKLAAVAAVGLSLAAPAEAASRKEQNAIVGGLVGALAGGLIGGDATGALVGAGAGALLGAATTRDHHDFGRYGYRTGYDYGRGGYGYDRGGYGQSYGGYDRGYGYDARRTHGYGYGGGYDRSDYTRYGSGR